MTSNDERIDELTERSSRIQDLTAIGGLLRWDQQVTMPSGGTQARASQRSTISGIKHELVSDPELGALLDDLEAGSLDKEAAAMVREARRTHERAASVPTELIEEIQQTTTEAHPIWETAREEDDFEQFAPILEEIIELRREYATEIDPDRDPYAVLFEDYEPYIPLSTAESILTEVRDALVPLIDQIHGAEGTLATDTFETTISPEDQEAFSRSILDELGYDWEHGRLDTSTHPFTSGTPFDARITTRYDESDPVSGIYSTIHEFGHAHYELGLPKDWYGTPIGDSRDLTVHESQSRFWENHVGRSRPFWDFVCSAAVGGIPGLDDVAAEDAYEAVNQVFTDNLIRVEADELTYHLHIVIRFEIERDLIAGELDVSEVPTVWNDKYEDYLGIRPPTDTLGCLQDVHWSSGLVGYFPTYSLGSILAAQLDAALRDDLQDVDALIREGDFDELSAWMRDSVHQHGSLYRTEELIEVATGQSFSAEPFISYVREKYRPLYGL